MNCVKCGNPIVDGNRFCMICGTPVDAAAPQAPAAGTAAPGPAPDAGGVAPVVVNQQTVAQAQAQPQQPAPQREMMPYAPPMTDGTNIIIPFGRKYRIVCPDCHSVSETLKRDETAAFPCGTCGKAYAYGGQLLLYRMGNAHPALSITPVAVFIDGVYYGDIGNRESLRIMLSTGNHVIGMGAKPGTRINKMQSNQFQITVGPQSNNLAFKVSVVYRYMGPYGLELNQCSPEEIPDI